MLGDAAMKKITALIIAFVMIISLAGCGAGNGSEPAGEATSDADGSGVTQAGGSDGNQPDYARCTVIATTNGGVEDE